MSGFVKNYEQLAGQGKGDVVMRCFEPAQLPVLATLARAMPLRRVVLVGAGADAAEPCVRALRDVVRPARHVARLLPYAKPSIYQRLDRAGRQGKHLLLQSQSSSTLGLYVPASDQRELLRSAGAISRRTAEETGCRTTRSSSPTTSIRAACSPATIIPITTSAPATTSSPTSTRRSDPTKQVWSRRCSSIVWDEHGGIFDHEIPPSSAHTDGFTSTTPLFDFRAARRPRAGDRGVALHRAGDGRSHAASTRRFPPARPSSSSALRPFTRRSSARSGRRHSSTC